LNPIRLEASSTDPTFVGSVVCERNRLQGDAGKQTATGTGEMEYIPAQLVLVSIGYKGVALPGTDEWFDNDHGSIRNDHGRVDCKTSQLGALYTAGWVKRGPTGIIGTNIPDAKQTVATIMADMNSFVAPRCVAEGIVDLRQLLKDRGIEVVDWQGYRRIESEERLRRRSELQPREKLVRLEDQLAAAFST
jgi:NADPH-dependent glutamate synthase beta subunit-like oxidoreductase